MASKEGSSGRIDRFTGRIERTQATQVVPIDNPNLATATRGRYYAVTVHYRTEQGNRPNSLYVGTVVVGSHPSH